MKFLALETSGDWTATFRREISPHVPIVETRSINELLRELAPLRTALVAIEIAENRLESSIAAVAQASHQFPNAVVVAMGDRRLGCYEAILREVGATHVIFSTRRANEIAAIVDRCLADEPENDFNAEERCLEDQIFERLPWSS